MMRISPFLVILIPVFILLVGIVIWLRPEWLITKLRRISPEVLYSVDTRELVVALTIDDGPDAITSPMILDLLKQYDAKATFFLISEHIPGNEAIVERMILEGHELGNHMTIDEPSIKLSIETFERKLIEADKVLSQYAEVRWLRPGSGWYNDEMLAVIHDHDYRCALGSVYPFDPQVGSAWFSIRYILWKVKPGDIIVLHDYQMRGRRTATALEVLLPEFNRRGYKLVTLSGLSDLDGEHPY
jgi:peptidoglycan/xylan/chitin deacetylase (PgdA/CDA1 family)